MTGTRTISMSPPGTITLADLPDEVLQIIWSRNELESLQPVMCASSRLLRSILQCLKAARIIKTGPLFGQELASYQELVHGAGTAQAALLVAAGHAAQQHHDTVLPLLVKCPWLARVTFRNSKLHRVSHLAYLQSMTLRSCQCVVDLAELPQLQQLHLDNCDNIMVITGPPSLVTLQATNCKKLQTVRELPQLQQLKASGCCQLTPVLGLPKLQELCIEGDYESGTTWSSMPSLACLQKLHLVRVRQLTCISNLPNLRSLFVDSCKEVSSISNLPLLEEAVLQQVPALLTTELSPALLKLVMRNASSQLDLGSLEQWPSLQNVSLTSCSRLQSIHDLNCLQQLEVDDCQELQTISHLPRLRTLSMYHCKKISFVGFLPGVRHLSVTSSSNISISHLPAIQKLHTECPSLSLCGVPALTSLDHKGGLSLSISDLPSLQDLTLSYYQGESLNNNAQLTKLSVESCPNLTSIDSLSSLRQLKVVDCPRLDALVDLPELQQLQVHKLHNFLGSLGKWADMPASHGSMGPVGPATAMCHASLTHSHGPQEQQLHLCCHHGLHATSIAQSLQVLIFQDVAKLTSIANLPGLKQLNVYDCSQLMSISSLMQLKQLHLADCRQLQRISKLPCLQSLHIQRCRQLVHFEELPELQTLHVQQCKQLTAICGGMATRGTEDSRPEASKEAQVDPSSSCNLPYQQQMHGGSMSVAVMGLAQLQRLTVEQCEQLSCITDLPSLESLQVSWGYALTTLAGLPLLQDLHVSECRQLESIQDMPSLKTLSLIESYVHCITNTPKLQHLSLSSCHAMSDVRSFPCLRKLELFRCYMLNSVCSLPELKLLRAVKCEALKRLERLPLLEQLEVRENGAYRCFDLSTFPQLRKTMIGNVMLTYRTDP